MPKDLYHIPIPNLSNKQNKIFQDLILGCTTTPTLENLFTKWKQRQQKTCDMLNIKNKLSILLLNASSLRLYIYDLFELLNQIHVSIMILNGTRHDTDTLKCLSNHLTIYQIFHQKGTNAFGGVLIAVHRSIPVPRVREFDNICNSIVLGVGNTAKKFQLATFYSPPNEKLPINILNDIINRNTDTIICGDLNAKHDSWSNTDNNQKGRFLFEWLHDSHLQVVNKCIPTSTRSNAVIDLILAPPSMISNPFTVLPSIGSDHYPVIWSPPFHVPSKDFFIPIKRTYWGLHRLFITFTFTYWDNLCSIMSDKIEFFTL
ncbi:unnamed protein product [Rotaria sp. Silwood2]|nr:unnamed protein product [Rotaria sp. Silwood2]